MWCVTGAYACRSRRLSDLKPAEVVAERQRKKKEALRKEKIRKRRLEDEESLRSDIQSVRESLEKLRAESIAFIKELLNNIHTLSLSIT